MKGVLNSFSIDNELQQTEKQFRVMMHLNGETLKPIIIRIFCIAERHYEENNRKNCLIAQKIQTCRGSNVSITS